MDWGQLKDKLVLTAEPETKQRKCNVFLQKEMFSVSTKVLTRIHLEHKTYAIHIVQYRNAGDDEIETF